ncbi:phytoene desaturase family protein [Balneolales bacterium ANBcel1]|nr:phytoene desaturase family protein [Balneolales bacterium ANBcel1]
MEKKKIVIIGSGLGGLSTALRLSSTGHQITILEKHATPGGRLNQIKQDGFTFDMGPSFMSMTYEMKELFDSCGLDLPVTLKQLDPLYQVFFEGRKDPFLIKYDLRELEKEFGDLEPGFAEKAERYLKRAGQIFHDTEHRIVKRNFRNNFEYLAGLTKVPPRHIPYLFRNIWQELERTFRSEEVRIIFSLIAFFLGSTPFRTPAIYSILNYTELKHDGYWIIEGGMYRLVEEIVRILKQRNVEIVCNTEITETVSSNGRLQAVVDKNGKRWDADLVVANADAAAFRGEVLKRPRYSEERLDKMDWTLAPFTIYLGVEGKIERLMHHNYFLGSNYRDYANTLFTSSESPRQPYYYVNVPSKSYEGSAPPGCENVFVLCPVPDLRFKEDWSDKEVLAERIIDDLSSRVGFDIQKNKRLQITLGPDDWADQLNLYKGSGLGLAHGMNQVGGFRPRNKDEKFDNLYYVGASTVPGTGLPMVIISSKLVLERISEDHGSLFEDKL